MNRLTHTGRSPGNRQQRGGRVAPVTGRPARACLAEPLEERVLMALCKASGGSGYSGTLSTNSVIRQQQLICDPAEPSQGSTSVAYDAEVVTLTGMQYGPGYGPLGNAIALVEIQVGQERRLQSLPSFLDFPQGKETGYVQVFYQLKGDAGQIAPARTFTVVDETGTEGVDTHALTFSLLPAVQDDALARYVIFADNGTHSGNPPDYLMTLDGQRLGPADLQPALASTAPELGSIYGTTFEDVNADGMYGAGDKPVGGVTVYVDLDRDGVLDDGEPTQVSADDDGTYLFRSLRPGAYQVREVTPKGFVGQMTVPAEGYHLVQVVAGRRVRFVDFGNLRPGTISGVVFNDVNGDGIRQRTEIGGVAGATIYADVNRNGVLDRGEPFDVSTSPSGAWTVGGLAPGTYVIRQIPAEGYEQTAPASFHVLTLSGSGDALTGVTFGAHAVGPRVVGVYVLGSSWSGDFLSYLVSSGLGDGKDGYLVNPSTQARAIPWTSFDQISIRFDSPTAVEAGDLAVLGTSLLGAVRYEFSDFFYNAPTRTARWRLARPPANDRLTLALDADKDGVVGVNGQPLDGEWANGADRYPSGDGAAGGDFNFGLNVLAGDVNGDGGVNALDLGQIKARLNRSTTNLGGGTTGYDPFADLTSDGRINALDLGAAKLRLNRRLPRILPVLAAVPVDSAATVASPPSITRDLFSNEPLV